MSTMLLVSLLQQKLSPSVVPPSSATGAGRLKDAQTHKEVFIKTLLIGKLGRLREILEGKSVVVEQNKIKTRGTREELTLD